MSAPWDAISAAALQATSGGIDLRQLFAADQALYANMDMLAGGSGRDAQQPTPSQQQQQASALHAAQQQATAYGSGTIGWGGQAIPTSSGLRVPWFGRSRGKAPGQQRQQRPPNPGHAADSGAADRPAGPSTSPSSSAVPPARGAAAPGAASPQPDLAMSVEEVTAIVRRLPHSEPLPQRVLTAMRHLDSRSVALLLKDLSKGGLEARAVELFEWLRALPDRHPTRAVCDVYTYTAMISLCIYQLNVDRAMELLAEMRARGVERNVHTYTALMNVCIKCGKLAAALDIFGEMKAEACTPNVVTYNTLIDVHGKLGQWEQAVGVLKLMRSEGVQPVLRTYNTLIIACNVCNQPREALAVHAEMLAEKFTPNSTTCNALISAYGKLGQLDKVLDVYQDMVWKGLERSVITYSSLISAAEKAGRWETALQLFEHMQRDGCSPNTVTYNSLITACGQGCQWERARSVFQQMCVQGCTPDVVTYTALISAYERGGQWHLALQAFQQMSAQGCRPDAIVYNAIIDTLWQTGVVRAQQHALCLFRAAVKHGHFRDRPGVGGFRAGPASLLSAHAAAAGALGAAAAADCAGGRAELNLHALTAGVAMLALYSWLLEIASAVGERGEGALPASLAIVTDAGAASKEQGNFVIKEAVAAMMAFWGAPFKPARDKTYLGVLEASGPAVAAWMASDAFKAFMVSLLPTSDAPEPPEAPDALLPAEDALRQKCSVAFDAVRCFETSHGLVLQNMCLAYLQQRAALLSGLLESGSSLGLPDEVVHDAVLLLDRTMSAAGADMPEDVLPVVTAAALSLSVAAGGGDTGVRAALAAGAGVPPQALLDVEWQVQQLLCGDMMAISTMRVLKVYLERLGYRSLGRSGIYALTGMPIMLAVEALFDVPLLNCRPSVVAAALLYSERRQRGAVPFWPSALAHMTGFEDLTTPELTCGVRTAQKLCRKALYTQIFRAQCAGLALTAPLPQHQPHVLPSPPQQPPQLTAPPPSSSSGLHGLLRSLHLGEVGCGGGSGSGATPALPGAASSQGLLLDLSVTSLGAPTGALAAMSLGGDMGACAAALTQLGQQQQQPLYGQQQPPLYGQHQPPLYGQQPQQPALYSQQQQPRQPLYSQQQQSMYGQENPPPMFSL